MPSCSGWRACGSARLTESARDPVTGAEEPARERAFAHAESTRGLLLREAGDVHGHERVAKLLRQLGNRCVDSPMFGRLGGVIARTRPDGHVVDQLGRRGAAPLGSALADQGFAQRPQQIPELVLSAKQPWTREHPRARLLHQVERQLFPC